MQAALRRVKREQRSVTRKLNDIDMKLTRSQRRLGQVSRDLGRAHTDLERAAEECRAAEGALSRQRNVVGDRLVAIYKQGRIGPAALLLQSASFGDASSVPLFCGRSSRESERPPRPRVGPPSTTSDAS